MELLVQYQTCRLYLWSSQKPCVLETKSRFIQLTSFIHFYTPFYILLYTYLRDCNNILLFLFLICYTNNWEVLIVMFIVKLTCAYPVGSDCGTWASAWSLCQLACWPRQSATGKATNASSNRVHRSKDWTCPCRAHKIPGVPSTSAETTRKVSLIYYI